MIKLLILTALLSLASSLDHCSVGNKKSACSPPSNSVVKQPFFDYCTISTKNTMCLYKRHVRGSKCMEVFPITLTEADKTTILTVHNDLRRKLAKGLEKRGNPGPQPGASNMRELTWDDELATMAQTWANQCNYAHDANRNVARFAVGQNLAIKFSTAKISGADWTSPINDWYNEVLNMDKAYVTSFPSAPSKGVIGHYTQAIWANSYKIGCGLISYHDTVFKPKFPYKMYYVCNYGPSGNVIGTAAYKIGAAATACPTGTIAKNGLCV